MSVFFFFNDTAPTEIYTLSLHDALPIWRKGRPPVRRQTSQPLLCPARALHRPLSDRVRARCPDRGPSDSRSEEHTSELQSHSDLVCRLLLEKKKIRSCSTL